MVKIEAAKAKKSLTEWKEKHLGIVLTHYSKVVSLSANLSVKV